MTTPTYGITFRREADGPRPAQPSDLSVIGLALPADDADAAFLPLNEPVAFDSGDGVALAKLGDSDLAHAVGLIDSQLADFQTSARIVAVRVTKGATDAETMTNIIGSRAGVTAAGRIGTGLAAFLRAGAQIGVIPRLIGAPGYTSQTTEVAGQTEANPVCAALPEICNALLAHAVVAGPASGGAAALNWRETLASGRLIPTDEAVKVSTGVGARYDDGAAVVLGLGARVDFQHGGFPFHAFANQQVHGIVGLKNYYPFSLTDGATEAQEILATKTGVFTRGQIGVETAAGEAGFLWIGAHNADTDPDWHFYNKTRARDWAHLALLKSIRLRLGRENVSPHSVQAVLNDSVEIGRVLLREGGSLGFRVGFEASKNSPADLRQGKFRIFFQTEEPPPIMQVDIDSRTYWRALEVTLEKIVAQAETLVPQFA